VKDRMSSQGWSTGGALVTAAVLAAGAGSLFAASLPGAGTVRLIDFVLLVALMAVLARLAFASSRIDLALLPGEVGPFYWAFFGALIMFPFLGVLVNLAPIGSLVTSARFIGLSLLLYLIGWSAPSVRALSTSFERALGIAVVLNVGYSVLQHLEFVGILRHGTLPHHRLLGYVEGLKFDDWGRATGLFAGPNELGWFGCAALVFFAALYSVRLRTRDASLAAFALMLPVLANARTALVISVGFLLLLSVVSVARALVQGQPGQVKSLLGLWGPPVVLGFVVITSAAFASSAGLGRIIRMFGILTGGVAADRSLNIRVTQFWGAAIDLYERYPWGYGADPAQQVRVIDSAWLSYLAQGGMLLPALFALFLSAVFVMGMRRYFGEGDPYGLALLGMAISVALGSLTLSPFTYPGVTVTFLLTLLICGGREFEEGETLPQGVARS
jgi:hypothetical protein